MTFSSPARKNRLPVRSSKRTKLIGKDNLVIQQLKTKHRQVCTFVGMGIIILLLLVFVLSLKK